jgi:single-stranded DNA-binding protein
MSYNKVFLRGRLTSDIEFKAGNESYAPLAKFTLAVHRNKDAVDLFRIVMYENPAENAVVLLKKDTSIFLVGELRSNSYVKDGEEKFNVDIIGIQFDVDEA